MDKNGEQEKHEKAQARHNEMLSAVQRDVSDLDLSFQRASLKDIILKKGSAPQKSNHVETYTMFVGD